MSIRLTFPLDSQLLPGEILRFEPTDYDRIKRYKGGDYEYAIYNNAELDENQRTRLVNFRKMLKEKQDGCECEVCVEKRKRKGIEKEENNGGDGKGKSGDKKGKKEKKGLFGGKKKGKEADKKEAEKAGKGGAGKSDGKNDGNKNDGKNEGKDAASSGDKANTNKANTNKANTNTTDKASEKKATGKTGEKTTGGETMAVNPEENRTSKSPARNIADFDTEPTRRLSQSPVRRGSSMIVEGVSHSKTVPGQQGEKRGSEVDTKRRPSESTSPAKVSEGSTADLPGDSPNSTISNINKSITAPNAIGNEDQTGPSRRLLSDSEASVFGYGRKKKRTPSSLNFEPGSIAAIIGGETGHWRWLMEGDGSGNNGPNKNTDSKSNATKNATVLLDKVENYWKQKQTEQEKRNSTKRCVFHLSRSMDARILRYVAHRRGNLELALGCLQDTQAWRRDFYKEPIVDVDILDGLQKGFVYFSGRDNGLRPLLIIRPKIILDHRKFWTKQKVVKVIGFAMEFMLRFLLVPGKVESMCALIDLGGIGLWGLPIDEVKTVIKLMQSQYVGRLYRMYVINYPGYFKTLYGMVSSLLTERQKQKVCFVANGDELRKGKYHPNQLETQYGGRRETLTEFYPFVLPKGPFAADIREGEGRASFVPNASLLDYTAHSINKPPFVYHLSRCLNRSDVKGRFQEGLPGDSSNSNVFPLTTLNWRAETLLDEICESNGMNVKIQRNNNYERIISLMAVERSSSSKGYRNKPLMIRTEGISKATMNSRELSKESVSKQSSKDTTNTETEMESGEEGPGDLNSEYSDFDDEEEYLWRDFDDDVEGDGAEETAVNTAVNANVSATANTSDTKAKPAVDAGKPKVLLRAESGDTTAKNTKSDAPNTKNAKSETGAKSPAKIQTRLKSEEVDLDLSQSPVPSPNASPAASIPAVSPNSVDADASPSPGVNGKGGKEGAKTAKGDRAEDSTTCSEQRGVASSKESSTNNNNNANSDNKNKDIHDAPSFDTATQYSPGGLSPGIGATGGDEVPTEDDDFLMRGMGREGRDKDARADAIATRTPEMEETDQQVQQVPLTFWNLITLRNCMVVCAPNLTRR